MSERPSLSSRIPELARMYETERWSNRSLQDNFEYAGHGGQNVVFRVKERVGREKEFRNIVLKADINFLRRGLIREAIQRWQQNPKKIKHEEIVRKYADSILAHPDDTVAMENEVKRDQEFFRNLRKFFSADEILHSRVEVKNVPVTPEVAKEIVEESHLAELAAKETVWVSTLIHYQRPIPGAAKEAASFGYRYVERFDIPQEDYQRLNAMTRQQRRAF